MKKEEELLEHLNKAVNDIDLCKSLIRILATKFFKKASQIYNDFIDKKIDMLPFKALLYSLQDEQESEVLYIDVRNKNTIFLETINGDGYTVDIDDFYKISKSYSGDIPVYTVYFMSI